MSANSPWISRKYTVQFLTPAFLGGADQSGQWRTPPFKALLRQWWRVAWAAQRGFRVNVAEMREAEGRLFGNAWLTRREGNTEKTDASRSLVRLRILPWSEGTLKSWRGLQGQSVQHPEVPQPVGASLYLGYGPLIYDRQTRQTTLKAPPSIEARTSAELLLALPESEAGIMERVLALMSLYGAVGGRSRNGWGSFCLVPPDGRWPKTALPLRDWRQALELDWPHCIGKDHQGPLIWRTARTYTDWNELMGDLTRLKIAIRTQFPFSRQQGPHPSPELRHWLAYPVTNHGVTPWDAAKLRLPNSLRFKVRCEKDDPKQLIGVIYHMPCSPPAAFSPNPPALLQVWQQVHQLLDGICKPANQRRLPQSLKPAVIQQISGITLQRSQE